MYFTDQGIFIFYCPSCDELPYFLRRGIKLNFCKDIDMNKVSLQPKIYGTIYHGAYLTEQI